MLAQETWEQHLLDKWSILSLGADVPSALSTKRENQLLNGLEKDLAPAARCGRDVRAPSKASPLISKSFLNAAF
jgi:hypothetical protein